MIHVTNNLHLDEGELEFDYVLASGPGGQHVNRTASAVQLRFNVQDSPSLPDPVKTRLQNRERNRINDRGELVIQARQHRSQHRNRDDATERLVAMIRDAAHPPKRRKPTRPSGTAKRKRIEGKKRQAEKKQRRKPPDW